MSGGGFNRKNLTEAFDQRNTDMTVCWVDLLGRKKWVANEVGFMITPRGKRARELGVSCSLMVDLYVFDVKAN